MLDFVLRVLLELEHMYCSYSQYWQYLGHQYCSYSKYSECLGREYSNTLSTRSTKNTRYSEYTRRIGYNRSICGLFLILTPPSRIGIPSDVPAAPTNAVTLRGIPFYGFYPRHVLRPRCVPRIPAYNIPYDTSIRLLYTKYLFPCILVMHAH